MPQLKLNFTAERGKTIQQRFETFHKNNPRVYEILRQLAFDAKHYHKLRKLGIRTLWERVRWHVFLETKDESGLKLNDHYHSRYVRLLVNDYPEFDGFFELRKLRAE